MNDHQGAPVYVVFLLHASSYGFRAEKLLAKAGIECKLVPVPRHLSSDCGVCLRVEAAQQQNVAHLLADAHLEVAGIHPL